MTRTTKILAGILIGLILGNGIWVIYDIRREIQFNKELTKQSLDVNDQVIKEIFKELNTNNKTIITINQNLEMLNKLSEVTLKIENFLFFKIDKNYFELNNKIINLPKEEIIKKEFIEYKLRQIVVIINNKTAEALGSGVTIKYNGQFYILSAGHMIDTKDDLLTFSENGQEIGELEIVKHEFSDVEDLDGFFDTKDLLLLRPKNKDLQPTYYTELTEKELDAPEQIYIVGSPAGIEDVLSDGRIIKYHGNFMYYIDHTYYGNSGGGVFTRDGQLVGIVSHMYPISLNPQIPTYMTYGAVRLSEIRKFLEDVK
jgi:hypothetical protein